MKCRRCGELHSWAWHPRGQRVEEHWGDLECDDSEPDVSERWWDEVDDHTFHVQGKLLRVVCKTCGGDKFQVGSGDWRTVIKCAGCGWERVIHDG